MPETPEIPETLPLAEVTAASAEAMASANECETPETAHVPEPTKENAPMLEVHPAHHAANSWRDFFIHIVTIVLGLLIAVGLEQTVEIFHHRHRVREAREQLRDEVRSNITIAKKDIAALNSAEVMLKRNIFILEQHRAGIKVPEKLDYTFDPGTKLRDGAVRSAEDTGALGLMPYNEIGRYRYFETTIATVDLAMLACIRESQQVTALVDRGRTQDQLTPEETRDLLTATTVALGDVRYAAQMFGFLSIALELPLPIQEPTN